jgi:hypothetical protein
MALSMTYLLETQHSLEQLRQSFRWSHDSAIPYETACQGVAVALVALDECLVAYETGSHPPSAPRAR